MYVNKYDHERSLMVEEQLIARGINDVRVLRAMSKVPREFFVLPEDMDRCYQDSPLELIKKQTISQPYVVAFMTQALRIKPEEKVLEIGTGCGYQTAVLAEMAAEVYTLEIIEELQKLAKKVLKKLGYTNINFQLTTGRKGWVEAAPFDKIIVTAAGDKIPQPLLDQLAPGGRLVAPVKFASGQKLVLVKKGQDGTITQENILDVVFVPLK